MRSSLASIKTVGSGNFELRDGTDVNLHIDGTSGDVGIGTTNPST